ncbi:hypothetical protein AB6A40_006567 [Gnathostoma spinigerum]|uniref:Apple domain-containing protein n=1 Tax=Gnathostoma spinigerum TaxID=75299 RepID=A0ABD6ES64_9BILA
MQQLCLLALLLATSLAGHIPQERIIDLNETTSEGSVASKKLSRTHLESLCVRMHNNTAFLGVEPYARLMVTSASDCRRHCINVFPKCKAVVFYYISGQDKEYACYLFDKNSIDEEVALVTEKPRTADDKIRALEVVINCHEFDPFPPLESEFVQSSDKVAKKKRDVCFDCPVSTTGRWTPWSECYDGFMSRSQPCSYGRLIQRQACPYSDATLGGMSNSAQAPAVVSGPQVVYPPNGYVHLAANTAEYQSIIASQRGTMSNEICCARQNFYRNLKAALLNEAASITIPECPVPCPYGLQYPGPLYTVFQPSAELPGFTGTQFASYASPGIPQVVQAIQPAPHVVHAIQPAPQVVHAIQPAPQIVHAAQEAPQVIQAFQPAPVVVQAIKPAEQALRRIQVMHPPTVGRPITMEVPVLRPSYTERIGSVQPQYRVQEHMIHRPSAPQAPHVVLPERVQPMPQVPEGMPTLEDQRAVKLPQIPEVPRLPHVEEGPQLPEAPRLPHVEGVPQIPGAPQVPQMGKLPSVAEVPSLPQAPRQPVPQPQPRVPFHIPEETETIEEIIETTPPPIWDEWSEWSTCSRTCGAGTQQRYRNCKTSACEGDGVEQRSCAFLKPCETWSMWTEWIDCSVTCGEGKRSRSRFCHLGEGRCDGENYEMESCGMDTPCAHWASWLEWTECTRTCGGGIRRRLRECIGGYCPGKRFEEAACNTEICSSWTNWQEWSHCSVSCGEGTKNRWRICVGESCEGESEETETCSVIQTCPEWAEWDPWSECTATCDFGIKRRFRTCNNGYCPGPRMQEVACESLPPCSAWSTWHEWSSCSATCGKGVRVRSRECTQEERCTGDEEETEECESDTPCSQWTEWGHWSECDKECGPGNKERNRECVTIDGRLSSNCYGRSKETIVCNDKPCCEWSQWSIWSNCNKQCGRGDMMRTRVCQRPGLDDDGCVCEGPRDEHKTCNEHPCPEARHTITRTRITGTVETLPQPEPEEEYGEIETSPVEKTHEEQITETSRLPVDHRPQQVEPHREMQREQLPSVHPPVQVDSHREMQRLQPPPQAYPHIPLETHPPTVQRPQLEYPQLTTERGYQRPMLSWPPLQPVVPLPESHPGYPEPRIEGQVPYTEPSISVPSRWSKWQLPSMTRVGGRRTLHGRWDARSGTYVERRIVEAPSAANDYRETVYVEVERGRFVPDCTLLDASGAECVGRKFGASEIILKDDGSIQIVGSGAASYTGSLGSFSGAAGYPVESGAVTEAPISDHNVACGWSNWHDWSACTEVDIERRRSRQCLGVSGCVCYGKNGETKACDASNQCADGLC